MAARVIARGRLAFNWEVVEYDRPKFGHYIGIQILQTTGPNPTSHMLKLNYNCNNLMRGFSLLLMMMSQNMIA